VKPRRRAQRLWTTLPHRGKTRALVDEIAALGYKIAKAKLLLPPHWNGDATAMVQQANLPFHTEIVFGTKHLGAAVGSGPAAHAVIDDAIVEFERKSRLVFDSGTSMQAQFAMWSTLLRGLTWRLSITKPELAAPHLAEADEAVWRHVLHMAGTNADSSTDMTRRLLHAPALVTGLGLPAFVHDQPVMHGVVMGCAKWPPAAPNKGADAEMRKAMRKTNEALKKEKMPFSKVWQETHEDEHDWLQVKIFTKTYASTTTRGATPYATGWG
jgi:hypothetical protein